MKKIIFLVSFCSVNFLMAQYERGSIDAGLGAIISIGLQEEVGFNIQCQYTSPSKKTSYIAAYNRYFIKELENTEVYNEFTAVYNRRLFHKEVLSITGGIGYIYNDYEVLSSAEDTSNLFFSTGSINHGVILKLRGLYAITTPMTIFVELNVKSFGKRYDTFAFGLFYSLGI